MQRPDPSFALRRPSSSASAFAPTLLLSGLLFFPPVLPFLVNAPSFLVGTIFICVVYIIGYAAGAIRVDHSDHFQRITAFASSLTLFVFAHLAICYMFGPIAVGRAIQTIPIIILFLLTIPIVVSVIFDRADAALDKAVGIVILGYILSAILSVVGLQPPGTYGEKPTFPFTEPSFFAFTIAPVLIYFCVTRSFLWRWSAVAGMVAFAVTVSNLTSIATSLVVMLSFARWWQIGGAVVAGYAIWPYVDQDYFRDRLTMNVDTVNLTSLVYMQGWQLLEESLRTTHGWGRGIQQLGAGYTNTIASYRINQLMGGDLNLLDGGFLLSKVGSEFGIFGLGLVCAFTAIAGLALLRLRAFAQGRASYSRPVVLCYASIVGSIIEIFLRGSTYFTGTMLLLCSAVFYLLTVRPDAAPISLFRGRRTEASIR